MDLADDALFLYEKFKDLRLSNGETRHHYIHFHILLRTGLPALPE